MWEIHTLRRSSSGDTSYPWHVTGINHHEHGNMFSWSVPDIANPTYSMDHISLGAELVDEARRPRR
jgi:hypothetical protein